jgi:25S rRNA (uracil2634-N3)-methyltransferase
MQTWRVAVLTIASMTKSGTKSSLKSALSSQQSRLKAKQKAAHAAQAAVKATKNPARHEGKLRARNTVPFSSWHTVLLVGEGDFSFTHALLVDPPPELVHLPAESVTATAFDTEAECYTKYPGASEIVANLRAKGVNVLFEVDATRLEKVSALKGRRWDRIVWNFPHAGRESPKAMTPVLPRR